MTMYNLPNFCRVCLNYDKNLIDLEHIENEPNETLMSKLQQCVSEVEWNVFSPLLCHPCIKRLNIAYAFKRQCIQSATVLKSYVALIKESKTQIESQDNKKNDIVNPNSAYIMLPNQKYIKIVMDPQNQGNLQNVFVNVVPTTSIASVISPTPLEDKESKDTNQSTFVNLNSTLQKFVPIAPLDANVNQTEKNNINVHQLLTDSKTEELSVEIDPTDFDLDDETTIEEDVENPRNSDWDEVISSSRIMSNENKIILNVNSQNGLQKSDSKSGLYGNFVPILPKQPIDDKNDFFNSGQHFLSSSQCFAAEVCCELCQKTYPNIKLLSSHIKDVHKGKSPLKCSYCFTDFMTYSELEKCLKSHKSEIDALKALNNTLTFTDYKYNSENDNSNEDQLQIDESSENGEYTCELCHRQFNSTAGLLRHKVRKHNQKNKKKYFIKGMKNAKCDICNREFSTQSYMQLHRKLHLRDDIGYKYKVFGKSKYISKTTDNKTDLNLESNSDIDDEKKENNLIRDNQKDQIKKMKYDNIIDMDENNLVIDEDYSDNNLGTEGE